MQLPTPDLPDLDRTALLVVDVQQGFDDAGHWGPRNNPACEANIAALLAEWRARGRPVVFVRHDSIEPGSPLRPGQPGNDLKAVVTGEPDLLVTKGVNSCFHGTPDLDAWLRGRDLDGLVLTGITTNRCCETTARVGANLGHRVLLALDATHTFDRRAPDGTVVSADELARVTATNLHGEFATVVTTRHLLAPGDAPAPGRRQLVSSGAAWEPLVGYSRAVRVGSWVSVAGTTAAADGGGAVGGTDVAAQTREALRRIAVALQQVGSGLQDVVRTRMFVTDISRWQEVGRAHGEAFGTIRPATSMIEVSALIDPALLVEVEADAVVPQPGAHPA